MSCRVSSLVVEMTMVLLGRSEFFVIDRERILRVKSSSLDVHYANSINRCLEPKKGSAHQQVSPKEYKHYAD